MYQLILIAHMVVAVILIGLILIQHGKGAEIGASFGSGASNTLFGSQGTGGFLFRLTGGLALAFFVTSLTLSYMVSVQSQQLELPVPKTSTPLNSIPVPAPVEHDKKTESKSEKSL